MPIAKPRPGIRVFSCLLGFFTLVALLMAPAVARAQSDEVIEKATKQNKKAIEEYENLNFEEARKILKETLDYCAANGLDKHPIKARTHIHLGIVILAGFKQRDVAIKQFRKALEIQPEIKLTKSLANPEIQEAFDEASAGMATPEKADAAKAADKGEKTDKADKTDKGDNKPEDKGPGADLITHDAVTVGTQGSAITITAKVDINQNVKKLILAYRPDGASEFLGRVMKEVTQGNWTAEIPATATSGNRVAYYIEAQAEDDSTMGKKGTEDDPLIIALKGSGAPVEKKADDEEEEDEAGPRWFLGLGIGSGAGYVASAPGEVNSLNNVSAGFAPASLGHLAPEVGYFVKQNILLSLQLRLQLVTGPNNRNLDKTDPNNVGQCGGDFVCTPAKNAIAALAKVTFLFGEEKFHPYLALAVGGGQIRHVVTFSKLKSCGPTATSTDSCVDTVLGGPVFVGGGLGFMYNVSDNFALTLGVEPLVGFPDFTLNFDFNAGVAVEF